ncbi:MAG: hypothetical protein VR64_20755 [Desulfatitalea sp. BRH_c12]|nr:MAG: hypothetical protein VR64_20755 [Desulfatitalea sp. BRH_c12]
MATGFNSKYRIWAQFILILLLLVPWVQPVRAASLKDIRVGQHSTFTRVVFELDTAISPDQILSSQPDQLTVFFPDTYPDLARKIPLKKLYRVNDLQLRSHKNRLSVTFHFDDRHENIDSFMLHNPARVVLDLHRSPTDTLPPAVKMAIPTPARVLQEDFDIHIDIPPVPYHMASEATGSTASQAQRPLNLSEAPSTPAKVITKTMTAPSAHRSGGLQYYLIMGLVILAISILVFLGVMLLTRLIVVI